MMLVDPYRFAPAGGGAVPWGEVVLLLHCNGSDGSTTVTDASGYSQSVTASGDAQISTAQARFGSASLLLDGTGDYLTVAGSSANALTADFTIEAWIRLSAMPSAQTYLVGWDGTQYVAISTLGVVSATSTSTATAPAALSLDTWHHVAIVREAGVGRVYLDGVGGATAASFGDMGSGTPALWIGTFSGLSGGAKISGHLDELRVVNGTAVYTEDFSPPSSPFPDS